MHEIKKKGRLNAEECICLYWYNRVIEKDEHHYKDFKITQSLIGKYNEFMKEWEKKFDNEPSKYAKVIDWDEERAKTDYYSDQMNDSYKFERWVELEFARNGIELNLFEDENQYKGENELGIEIKHDKMLKNTGNVYIEVKERIRNNMDWVDSGILKEDNTSFILIGDEDELYIIEKNKLIEIYNKIKDSSGWVNDCMMVKEKAHQTSIGFIIRREKAKQLCYAQSIKEFVRKRKNGC